MPRRIRAVCRIAAQPTSSNEAIERSTTAAARPLAVAQNDVDPQRKDDDAHAAATSKAQIYSYVGNKDALFDAVVTAHVLANVGAVPLTVDDLPGYAVRLYDAYLADPALVRLVTWTRLERTPTGGLFGELAHHDEANLRALSDAQSAGILVDDVGPEELWALLISLAGTWAQAAIVHAANTTEEPQLHERRKQALASTTRRAFCTTVGR